MKENKAERWRREFDSDGKCPICQKVFHDCPHSLTDAERVWNQRIGDKRIEKLIDQRIEAVLKRHGLIKT